MNICGHLTADDQIVGIGPLMMDTPTDPIGYMYNKKKLSFKIYLKGFAAAIESDILKLGTGSDPDENEKKAREMYKDFKVEYDKIVQIISRKIDEDRIADYTGPR